MAKIENKALMDLTLGEAFSAGDIRHLWTLMDIEMCDWTEGRRGPYEPLFDDLYFLLNALNSEGRDFSARKSRQWADGPVLAEASVVVQTVCFCGHAIKTVVADKGLPLTSWGVVCEKHEGAKKERYLGTVLVKGATVAPKNAQLTIQQAILNNQLALEADPTYRFKAHATL